MSLLALGTAIACVPAAVEASFLRTVGAPCSLLCLLSRDVNGTLLLELALLADFVH